VKRIAETENAIAARAARQHGLVTLDQLRELGFTYSGVRSRLDTGLLARAGRGVFRIPSAPVTWEQRLLSAFLANRPNGVVSHFAAARLLGIDVGRHERVDVMVPVHRRGSRARGVNLHWSRSLVAEDVVEQGLFRVTSLPRTFLDIAGLVPHERLMDAFDDAVVRRRCRPTDVAAGLELAASRTRRGVGTLRTAVNMWLGDATPASVAESRLLRSLDAAHISRPICQHELREGDFVAVLDFAWTNERVAVEMDGYRYHASPRAQAHDVRRANRLVRLGWTVLRTTPYELKNSPESFLNDLIDQLAARKGS
jgi:very-short-patch-repair endonuclease